MGLFDKFKSQFIDIIEWVNPEPDILVHRFERYDNEIKMGARLIVRPGQRAVFVNEGRIADAFDPGTHKLSTKNMPIITTLLSLPYAFESPFKAEVYFIKTTEQLDRKWGTPNPVMLRDTDFGMVRLRARGNYSYKVGITEGMITRFVGTQGDFSCDRLEDQIRIKVVSSFTDCLGEHKIAALDLAAKYDEISGFMKEKLSSDFAELGLELLTFILENISVPDEVQKAMDQRSAMGAVGNLNNYSQYQAANALRDAAQNEGGAGNMMGMMMGAQMANGISGTLQQSSPGSAPPPLPKKTKYFVAVDGKQTGPFELPEVEVKIKSGEIARESLVWTEGMSNWEKAVSRMDLSGFFASVLPPLS
ncbi:SPFH domain-containing protein [Lentisphaerota bacterium ZTH]|nr:SPFH domain-containing protein [Lentisphaerota bacterium]WET07264.1 SPFH domain-containing protein [Lentisphaerota bacterium ZTH]